MSRITTDLEEKIIIAEGTPEPLRLTKTLLSGENVVAGEVLGIDTASDKIAAYDDGAADGTEIARAIAAEDVDAGAGDKPIVLFVLGAFIKDNLTGLDTAGELDLRDRGVWMVDL